MKLHCNNYSEHKIIEAFLFFLGTQRTSFKSTIQLTGKPDVEESGKFVSMFDKFFDSLNVTNYTEGMCDSLKVFPVALPFLQ